MTDKYIPPRTLRKNWDPLSDYHGYGRSKVDGPNAYDFGEESCKIGYFTKFEDGESDDFVKHPLADEMKAKLTELERERARYQVLEDAVVNFAEENLIPFKFPDGRLYHPEAGISESYGWIHSSQTC